ncbi:hypothetical protein Drose_37660 [Dactylosporangium roseum]|uniref:Peptidase MA-like domain-containing protein n=1 Tax=Dactylosporangium roseum TaxID=47989 RepID=A0ABY5Z8F0_9ACTN|nr:hypothetical protein [Dactylosporangium roseum]UWZ36659.1 hypothetical protein Drose_37660 [Dactylosporangium roseum]
MTIPDPTAAPVAPPHIPQQRQPARPVAPPWYPPQPPPWPPPLPPQPRRSYLWPVLTVLLVVSMVLALGGAATAAWALRDDGNGPIASTWVDMRPDVGGRAIEAVLHRHAEAVRKKDLAAWMADVDQTDAVFAKRQKQLFENLTKMPFAELAFQREAKPPRGSATFLPSQLFDRYHAAVHVEAVTIRHRIEGVDSKPVGTPWLPVFGYTGGKWLIAGDGAGAELPTGANGQPWDAAGPVTVKTSDHVVAVLSADDADRAKTLLTLAEDGLRKVATIRPTGWDGKVFLTAIQDKRIFDTYFAESPDRVAQVAAIAVPYYNQVADWATAPAYGTTRVVFNPTELSAQTEELAHDLTHEFAHAAMGPVTGARTPRWVVEGFAEYVAYKDRKISSNGVRAALGDLVIGAFPTDQQFYNEPRNYVSGWLACRMIAEKYGQAKLIAFYEAFQRMSEVDSVSREVLGVGAAQLETQWRDYVAQQRG